MRGPPLEVLMLWLVLLLWVQIVLHPIVYSSYSYEGPHYDYTAYTECKSQPEAPLYGGGILTRNSEDTELTYHKTETGVYSPAFVLYNLTETTRYSFSCWVKIKGTKSAVLKARLSTDITTLTCIGTSLARSGCWSFLKGGFVLDSSSRTSVIYFQSDNQNATIISVKSANLQPFSAEQWNLQQENSIHLVVLTYSLEFKLASTESTSSSYKSIHLILFVLPSQNRKRSVTVHVSDTRGSRITGANVSVFQLSKNFPFGSAISKTILGNKTYQAWFRERFNAAVFENELKWYATEPKPGILNYSIPDEMLEFIRANQIMARGHNIFWEDPRYTPSWVRNLTGDELRAAVNSRIDSLLTRYKGDFAHWDVSNEMLHFDFYEERLGTNASLVFFNTAQRSDPLATLFMNDFNVVESCDDVSSNVDSYASRLKELKEGWGMLEGIGLEGHFSKPSIPLMRAVLDKLATLELPISKNFDQQTQAKYLEEVLREGFSHPSVNGIMIWSALDANGCYQMCLTDGDFHNLPAGDVVDRLLQEWNTKELGVTDDHGSYSFNGFLGEYKVFIGYRNISMETTFSLDRGIETKQINIQI